LFPLTAGEKTKWILLVNVNSGAPAGGSGCQYFVGDFDGKSFKADPQLSKARPGQKSESALWLDHGPDCYAAVTWSDVPSRDGRRLALGWMSNWQYANEVPTSPWRGAMTIPRELSLRETADGLRLIQKPVKELAKLREPLRRFKEGTAEEVNAWIRQNGISGTPLEMLVEFAPASEGVAGVKLFKSAKTETVLRVDRGQGVVLIDRTRSGNVGFHPKFSGVSSAPLSKPNCRVSLHIFADTSSVEVLVDDGEQVLTCLVFPSEDSRAVELFGPNEGKAVSALDVWPLTSCWKTASK
jgi:fructan beta-fructosidase